MNNTIGLIFSKDRAMQLQADIESFYLHCSDADSVDMTILYKVSDQRHRRQYDTLKRKFTSVTFVEENNFRSQVLSLLDGYEYVLFLVDDNMFIKPFTVSQAINCLQKHTDTIGFSLRLGKNTTYCYANNVPQNLPAFQSLGGKVMKYNWTCQQADFNYPLEVSSSIYKIADIMPLLVQINFHNPNKFEGAMAQNAKLYRELRPSLLCYEYSVAFCDPVNIVQQTAKNRFGTVNNYTVDQLADLFDRDMSIDVAKYKDFIPNSTHHEVQLYFRKDALIEQQSETFVDTVKDDVGSVNTASLPQFSIIMANYNHAKYIAEAIESVLKQTFTDWQLVIIDDGSTDDSLAVINKYLSDLRIRLIRHEKNSGYTASLKTGIASLQTELFGILDSDDCLGSDAIETMYAHHIAKPDCGLIYSQFMKCHENMSVRDLGFCAPITGGMSNVELDVVSHFKTFKLSHYFKTAGYDDDIMYAEDKDIAYRMEEVTKLFFVDKCLYYYRKLPNSIGHAGRTVAIGEMARGKAKLNAFIRRKILSTRPLFENPQADAKPLLNKLKTNHPLDIALFLDVLELAWHRQLLNSIDLPAQSQSWPIENIIFWMAFDLNFRDIIDLIGDNILDLCSARKQIILSRQKTSECEQSGTLDSARPTPETAACPENNKQVRSDPLFTIIMANYNNAKYIAEAIDSVLAQTFVNWEIIIVDDASTDNSLEVIDNYLRDKRIRLLRHDVNQGYTAALKTGIANVRSEYFGLLDSDDIITPNTIEVMYAAHIEHPDCGLIYSQLVKCKEDMTPYHIGYSASIPEGAYNVDVDKVSQLKTFKLSHYLRTAGYDNEIMYAEDKDIIYQMEEVSKLFFVDECLYYYRELPNSIAHSGRTHTIGIMAMGKAKLNAFRRRKKISSEPLLENPRTDAKPLLDKLKASHPKDIGFFLNVLKLALHRQMFDSIDLPEQARFWSTESTILWIALNIDFRDNIDLIGDTIIDLFTAIIYFQKAQQAFATKDFQPATDYIGQYKAKMDYSLLPVTEKPTIEKTIPDISVVIVTYNRSKEVRELIGCLTRQDTSGFEVIVVDNNDEKDESISKMVDKYIDCPINFNLSEGRNIGSYFAKGRILVFIDDDALVDSNYISSIKQAFDEYDIFGLRGRAYPKTNADANNHITIYNMGEEPLPTFCSQEGNSAFLRDVYMEMDGMDPLLFGHEGSDFTYRIIKKYGLKNKIIYWPKTIIYHDYGTGEIFVWKEQVHAWSRDYIAAKHGQDYFNLRQSVNAEPMPPRKSALNYLTPSPAAFNAPKVSIVMPCYNSSQYLPECLDSILAQTMPDWELFILDDASTDDTPEIIKNYAAGDKRIKPYYFTANEGPYVRRNFAIERAAADFIVIQDADDIMHHTKLQRFYDEIIEDPRLGIVGSFFLKFLDEFKGTEYADRIEKAVTHEEIMANFPHTWHIGWHASAIIRKNMFDAIGPYDAQPYGSDTFWMAKAGLYALETNEIRVKNIPEYLTYKREHLSSQTGTIPPQDPRGRRVKLEQYIINMLSKIQQDVRVNPTIDLKTELRNCKCTDFRTRYGHLFSQWETQPLTEQMLKQMVDKAFAHFTVQQFASCAILLHTLERIAPGTENNFTNIDLIRGLAYFAMDDEHKSRKYASREYRNHRNETALEFIHNYLDTPDPALLPADRHRIVKNTWYSAEMNSAGRKNFLPMLKRGIDYLNNSLPTDALACFDQALNAGCNISCLHHARTVALMQLGRTDEAKLAYQAEMAAGPSRNETELNRMSKDNNLQII